MNPDDKREASLPSAAPAGPKVPIPESAAAWKLLNSAAIAAYNCQVEEEGVFSDGLRTF